MKKKRKRLSNKCLIIILLAIIILAGFFLRAYFAYSTPLVHDEIEEYIPLSQEISFDKEKPGLPDYWIGHADHPALGIYTVKTSSMLFGTSKLGYRFLNVILGSLTISLIYYLGSLFFNRRIGLLSAAILAFNPYHIGHSAVAMEMALFQFLLVLCLILFWKLIKIKSTLYAVLLGVVFGLAYLTHETIILILIACIVYILVQKKWSYIPKLALMVVIIFIVISPDLYITAINQDRYENYGASYVNSIGLSPAGFNFYLINGFNDQGYLGKHADFALTSMDLITGIILLFGLFYSLSNWKIDPHKILTLSVIVVLAAFTFITNKHGFSQFWWANPSLFPAIISGAYMLDSFNEENRWFKILLIIFLIYIIINSINLVINFVPNPNIHDRF